MVQLFYFLTFEIFYITGNFRHFLDILTSDFLLKPPQPITGFFLLVLWLTVWDMGSSCGQMYHYELTSYLCWFIVSLISCIKLFCAPFHVFLLFLWHIPCTSELVLIGWVNHGYGTNVHPYHIWNAVADPGFSPGGAPTPKSAIIFQFFAKNCMKMKEFGAPGGARVPGAPLGSANGMIFVLQRTQVCIFIFVAQWRFCYPLKVLM